MYCCISGCSSTSKDNRHKSNGVKFYIFPTNSTYMPWLREKRQKWINAVKKHIKHPISKNTTICSAHFIGNKKSENPLHLSYVPTIFPGEVNNGKKLVKKIQRFERHQRQMQQAEFVEVNTFEDSFQELSAEHSVQPKEPAKRSIGCQKDDSSSENQTYVSYFFCNLINSNGVCGAQTQANIVPKIIVDKSSKANISTDTEVMMDFSCDPLDQHSEMLLSPEFHRISSLKTRENLISSTGVTFSDFNMLLNLLPDFKTSGLDKGTRLLITLMKLKTGLSFSVLSVIFQIHRTTVYRIFETNLFLLHSALKKFIIWPSKSIIKANMPESFQLHYPNTRVILDYTEVHTEHPSTVKERIHMYSDYRHDYTVKFLVGYTPCGSISFVSKCYEGSSSDCFIKNDCGVIDLLETGDTILEDKGFPSIKTYMPPFLNGPQFSLEELEETYKIASVRIHIERIMRKIKQFHIFDKLPISLLKYRDEIVYVVCALVNIENPIIKQ